MHVAVQISQHHLVEREKKTAFSPTVYSCLLCHRLTDHISMGLFRGSLFCSMGFPGGSVVKNPPVNAGDIYKRHRFDLWVEKIPWTRKQQPTPAFLPGKSHGQRSLVPCMGSQSWTRLSMHAFYSTDLCFYFFFTVAYCFDYCSFVV